MGKVQNCEIGLLLSRMKKADNKTAYKVAETERLKEQDAFKGSKFTLKQQRIRQIKRGFGNTW